MTEEDEEFERIAKKRQYLIDYIMEPPLVSKQKEWVGLTEDEVKECFAITPDMFLPWHIYKRIEAKLKERNT